MILLLQLLLQPVCPDGTGWNSTTHSCVCPYGTDQQQDGTCRHDYTDNRTDRDY